jgi:hypothetical protein
MGVDVSHGLGELGEFEHFDASGFKEFCAFAVHEDRGFSPGEDHAGNAGGQDEFCASARARGAFATGFEARVDRGLAEAGIVWLKLAEGDFLRVVVRVELA